MLRGSRGHWEKNGSVRSGAETQGNGCSVEEPGIGQQTGRNQPETARASHGGCGPRSMEGKPGRGSTDTRVGARRGSHELHPCVRTGGGGACISAHGYEPPPPPGPCGAATKQRAFQQPTVPSSRHPARSAAPGQRTQRTRDADSRPSLSRVGLPASAWTPRPQHQPGAAPGKDAPPRALGGTAPDGTLSLEDSAPGRNPRCRLSTE